MDKELDELRRDVGRFLDDLVDDDGLSPRLIAAHTQINYRRLYRWLSADVFSPPLKECHAIIDLVKRVEKVKADYADIATSWDPDKYDRVTLLGLFNYAYLKVLEDESLDVDSKAKKLTLMTFREWARSKGAI